MFFYTWQLLICADNVKGLCRYNEEECKPREKFIGPLDRYGNAVFQTFYGLYFTRNSGYMSENRYHERHVYDKLCKTYDNIPSLDLPHHQGGGQPKARRIHLFKKS